MCSAGKPIRQDLGTSKQLHDTWKERHTVYFDKEQEKIKGNAAESMCHQLGMCVCGQHQGSSPESLMLWENLRIVFKQVFWKRKKQPSPMRRLLEEDHRIVVQFQAVEVQLEIALAEAEPLACHPPSPKPQDVWLSLGYIHFGNWHFAALQMFASHELHPMTGVAEKFQLLDVDFRDGCNSRDHMVRTDLGHVKRLLDFAWKWKVTFWQITDEEKYWPILRESTCVPVVLCDCESFVFWQGLSQEKEKRRQAAEKAASKEKKTARKRQTQSGSLSQGQPSQKKRRCLKDDQEKRHAVDEQFEGFGLDVDLNPGFDLQLLDGVAHPIADVEHSDSDHEPDNNLANAAADVWMPPNEDDDIISQCFPDDCDVSEIDPSSDSESDVPDLFDQPEPGHETEEVQPKPQSGPAASSSSAAAEMELPPPPAPPSAEPEAKSSRAPRKGGVRTYDRQILDLGPLGNIRYYPQQQTLTAVCTWPSHGDCRLSRTTKGSEFQAPKSRGQGRPL